MKIINIALLKKGDILLNVGTVTKIVEYSNCYRVQTSPIRNNEYMTLWLTYDLNESVYIKE